jgi:8-oxo-dGTP pyrophosphatase MutT (NUDIX family)
MVDSKKGIAIPRPAATVVILRDGREGLEVFMVVRHHEIDFASGALVFPGGKVDEQDADPAWAELAPSTASTPDRSFMVAAARETFEEAGLVLARHRGAQPLLDAQTAHRLVERYRAPMLAGETSFLDVVRSEGLLLAPDLMVRFAHWITPETQPKRFDTHFLLVSAPVGQLGAHDGAESVEGFWIAPKQALSDAEAGTRTLLFPTHMNLLKLAAHATVAGAVAAARGNSVVTVTPRVERTATGRTLHIPAEAGYGITQWAVPAPKR